MQTTDVSVRQDSLDALLSVLTRFGENVAEPWQLVEALLAEVGCAEGAHQKKGLACIRALPPPASGRASDCHMPALCVAGTRAARLLQIAAGVCSRHGGAPEW